MQFQFHKKSPYAAAIIALLLTAAPAYSYQLHLQFLSPDAAAFQVGRMVPGDLSNANDLDFNKFDPFFQITVNPSGDSARDPERAYMICRFEAADRPIFTVSSNEFEMALICPGTKTNHELASIPEIDLGSGGEQISADNLLPYINGGLLKSGRYTLTIIIARTPDWNDAVSNNFGMDSRSVVAQNIVQVVLRQPGDGATIRSNPTFLWSFPRTTGIDFHLDLVSGNPGDDPNSAIEAASEDNVYARVDIPNHGSGGQFSAFPYVGSGDERRLTAGATYFWRIVASVQTMFPDEAMQFVSPAYSFTYQPAEAGGGGNGGGDEGGNGGGGNGGGGAGGGGGGGASGGAGFLGGSGEQGAGPPAESPVFSYLHRMLTEDQYQAIITQFPNLDGWNIASIRVDGENTDADAVARLLRQRNITITNVTIQ